MAVYARLAFGSAATRLLERKLADVPLSFEPAARRAGERSGDKFIWRGAPSHSATLTVMVTAP